MIPSVLLLSTQWQADQCGVAVVSKSLATAVSTITTAADDSVNATEGNRSLICAIVEEDRNIEPRQKSDASKLHFQLRGIKKPRSTALQPTVSDIDKGPVNFYHHFLSSHKFGFVIGHVPSLANAAFNIQDFYSNTPPPKVVLIIHSLPKTDQGAVDGDLMYEWLQDASIVLSVGHTLYDEVQDLILALDEENKPKHSCYLPYCSPALLTEIRPTVSNDTLRAIQNIVLFLRSKPNLASCNTDFILAVSVLTRVSAHLRQTCGLKVKLTIVGSHPSDKCYWEEKFEEIKQNDETADKRLEHVYVTVSNEEDIKKLFKRSTLCLLPLKWDCSECGIEAVMAAYTSLPILVSEHSGVAHLLKAIGEEEPIVTEITGNYENDINKWTEKTIQKLYKPSESQHRAEEIRKKLLVNSNIAASQLQFIRYLTDNVHVTVKIELDEAAAILQSGIEMANRFTEYLSHEEVELMDAHKFTAVVLLSLLHHREKIQLNLLDHILPPEVKEAWLQVLSLLEENGRSLIHVYHGSIHLTLYCPTKSASRQLISGQWNDSLLYSLTRLIKAIGVTTTVIRICPMSDVDRVLNSGTLSIAKSNPRRRAFKGPASEARSSGYWTKVTGSSFESSHEDITEAPPLPPMERLDSWLDSQEAHGGSDRSASNLGANSVILLHKKLNFPGQTVNQIAVSQSGCIAVLADKTNLQLITGDEVQKLGSGLVPWGIHFVTRNGKEFLAAMYGKEGLIMLWDSEGKGKIVYTTKDTTSKSLCVIDEQTIALGEQRPSPSGFTVHILNTEGDKWKLKNTLLVDIWCSDMYNMCYMKGMDGVSSLIMCSLVDKCVFSVDLIGGRIRWQKALVDMGRLFQPMSVCAGERDHVYVANLRQHCIHILSGDDGTEIYRIPAPSPCPSPSPLPFQAYMLPPALSQSLVSPTSLYIQGNYLYVSHRDESNEQWQISKIDTCIT